MPQLWQTLNAEVAEEAALDQGMGIYYRSGHRSAPRTATIVWAGDQRTSFDDDDGLPTVVPIGLGLAAAGVLYGHDIAGYQFIGNSRRNSSSDGHAGRALPHHADPCGIKVTTTGTSTTMRRALHTGRLRRAPCAALPVHSRLGRGGRQQRRPALDSDGSHSSG